MDNTRFVSFTEVVHKTSMVINLIDFLDPKNITHTTYTLNLCSNNNFNVNILQYWCPKMLNVLVHTAPMDAFVLCLNRTQESRTLSLLSHPRRLLAWSGSETCFQGPRVAIPSRSSSESINIFLVFVKPPVARLLYSLFLVFASIKIEKSSILF